mgnify:CR=1 FL=1
MYYCVRRDITVDDVRKIVMWFLNYLVQIYKKKQKEDTFSVFLVEY